MVVRSYYARRMNDHGVKPLRRGVEHGLGSLGLSLGIAANYGVGRKVADFIEHLRVFLLWDSVY